MGKIVNTEQFSMAVTNFDLTRKIAELLKKYSIPRKKGRKGFCIDNEAIIDLVAFRSYLGM